MGNISRTGSHRVDVSSGDFFRQHGYTPVPSLVQWFATLRCSMSCAHCLAATELSGFDDMGLEMVFRLLDQVSDMGVGEFLLTGGEPLERRDLPDIIEYMGRKGISWSLNTARMPSLSQRKALEASPPSFVAVSLDGPEEVHDSFRGSRGAFREAMDAIGYFSSLDGVEVCAGTTVTALSYPYLQETFHLAASSGAGRWGIHMLVPEGRASYRRDLFLSRRQLRHLVRFVAKNRKYFDVEMADEIGYLAHLEPLVRERPLSCGAGRSQCVVLPDGEVVPCTTLDRCYSAGNIHRKPLAEIWKEGFSELRQWRPEGRCAGCEYAPACRGGCWLQRKSGTQCFRDVWHVPEALRSTAGLIICLGAAAAAPAEAQVPTFPVPVEEAEAIEAETTGHMERSIIAIYVSRLTGLESPEIVPDTPGDPGWRFVTSFAQGTLPSDIAGRCRLVQTALDTECRSLSLVALLWRSLSEEMLDGEIGFDELDSTEKSIYLETMEKLRQASLLWRPEFLRNNLLPFINRGVIESTPFFMLSKAGPRPGQMEEYALSRDLAMERLAGLIGDDSASISREYMEIHPFAEDMELALRSTGSGNLYLQRSRAGTMEESLEGEGVLRVSVFDRVSPGSEGAVLSLAIRCEMSSMDSYPYYFDVLDQDTEILTEYEIEVQVFLEGGKEYTYASLINEIHAQNSNQLDKLALEWMSGTCVFQGEETGDLRVVRITQNEAAMWPSVRRLAQIKDQETVPELNNMYVSAGDIRYSARLKDCDLWMF